MRAFLVLNDDVVTELLKGGLPVLGIFYGAILRVLEDDPKGLLPRPVGLDAAAAEELDKSGLSLFGSCKFGFIVRRNEGLCLRVVSVSQLTTLSQRLSIVSGVPMFSLVSGISILIVRRAMPSIEASVLGASRRCEGSNRCAGKRKNLTG